MGGRLRGAGEDLYDIRRGSAVFGRFVGAGRRFREVSVPAGLELPRLTWPSLARWARIFDEFCRISSSFGGSWRGICGRR